eukprot:341895-Pleurochrysis_carterae.AAC.1
MRSSTDVLTPLDMQSAHCTATTRGSSCPPNSLNFSPTAECTTPPALHTSTSSTASPNAPSGLSWSSPVLRSPPAPRRSPFGTTP